MYIKNGRHGAGIYGFDYEYRYLSNFYYSPIRIQFLFKILNKNRVCNFVANTNEHAFQASKSTNLEDCESILLEDTPGKAKRKGRHIILRNDWDNIKYDIMKFIRLEICETE